MQLAEYIKSIKQIMEDNNIPEADTQIRIILRDIASIDTAMIMGHPEMELPENIITQINNVIDRRLRREPLQYILGSWNFMGLDFCVEPEVLIPRPDTEVLVETAMRSLHDGMRILDLCTGTGCILISLLNYSNNCSGTGVDISDKAISLSRRNAQTILGAKEDISDNLDSVCSFVLADLYDGAEGIYDLIVSNPPYIATDVIETLEPEVAEYEPHLALDGGADGYDLVKRIILGASKHLIPGGQLMMEIGHDQGAGTCELMEQSGFIGVECIKDYAGLDRVVIGTLPIL